ncbi:hypothetical protein PT974_12029 [Cladobotryum mycophilum]|uniref:2,5-diamino-6-ribosylamino-4(3H)-pyrimidinone 5'-phosphate reductase n=1 Tax=Cladobotryum mycophilum TaxID=491253 RepID=A0ABR0S6U6_9HYPO
MRRLRYNVAISLDGFIASLDGSSGWIIEDDDIDFDALYAEFDTFIMGRKTYEAMTSFEPNHLANQTKESVIVVSKQMKQENFPTITILTRGIVDAVTEMKTKDGKDIWLMGGGQLAGPCLEAGLVDYIEAAIMPVVLGTGIKMISDSALSDNKSHRLELGEVKRLEKSGILMTKYKVVYTT